MLNSSPVELLTFNELTSKKVYTYIVLYLGTYHPGLISFREGDASNYCLMVYIKFQGNCFHRLNCLFQKCIKKISVFLL